MNKLTTLFFSASAIAVIAASTAAHAETGMTREQAQAQLVAAEQSGDIFFGDQGKTLREMHPDRYVQTSTTDSVQLATEPSSGKTRAQVEAELAAAQRAGELSFGQEGLTQRELHRTWYPGSDVPSAAVSTGGETHDQELASLTAAARAGEISTEEVAMIMRELHPAASSQAAATGDIATMDSSTPAN